MQCLSLDLEERRHGTAKLKELAAAESKAQHDATVLVLVAAGAQDRVTKQLIAANNTAQAEEAQSQVAWQGRFRSRARHCQRTAQAVPARVSLKLPVRYSSGCPLALPT